MSEPRYKEGDCVLLYGWPVVIKGVEVRAAGFPDYFVQMQDGGECTWAQENELEDECLNTESP